MDGWGKMQIALCFHKTIQLVKDELYGVEIFYLRLTCYIERKCNIAIDCFGCMNSLQPIDERHGTWSTEPDGTKPLPDPFLRYHQRYSVAFTWAISWKVLMNLIRNMCLEITFLILLQLPESNQFTELCCSSLVKTPILFPISGIRRRLQHSLSRRMSYRKILWRLEAARFLFRILQSLGHLTGTSAAALARCLWNFRAIQTFWHIMWWLQGFAGSYGKTSIDPHLWL